MSYAWCVHTLTLAQVKGGRVVLFEKVASQAVSVIATAVAAAAAQHI
jgi:hypothetical protein